MPTTLDARKNFGITNVAQGYDAAAVSITVSDATKFPDPAVVAYNIVWWNASDYSNPSDDPNVEIVRVTARTGNVLTITRAQESTSASTKNTSGKVYRVMLALTAKTISDIETAINALETLSHTQGTDQALDDGGANEVTASEARAFIDSKGNALGLATLDGGGKVPFSQLPAAIMVYKGTWNATTNTPTLIDGTGTNGDLYRVAVAGTQDLGSGSIAFNVGDYVIYNGTTWEKSDTTDAVTSVNGYYGEVVLDTDDISEGSTNLWSQWAPAVGGIAYTGGLVGIGPASPITKLHVSTTAAASMTLGSPTGVGFTVSPTGGGYGMNFGANSDGKSWIQGGRVDGTATAYDISLQASGGNVGIGNPAPGSLLHLGTTFDNDAATPTLSFGDGDTGLYESADDQLQVSIAGTQKFTFLGTRMTSQNGAAFSTSASSATVPVFIPTTGALTAGLGGTGGDLSLITAGVSRIYIESTGDVGIMNTAPAYALDVTGDVNASGKFRVGTTQMAYLPGQTSFTGSSFFGNGGASLSYVSGSDGKYNTGVGLSALEFLTTGNNNTALGFNAMQDTTTGLYNVAIGSNTLFQNTIGNYNMAIGGNALGNSLSNGSTVGIGWQSGMNVTADSSVFIGHQAGRANSTYTTAYVTAIGFQAAYSGPGNYTTAIGYKAGFTATGTTNTFIGYQAGDNVSTGSNNLIIGNNIDAPSATTSNQLNIGNIIFGTGVSGTGTTIAGNIGIGVTNPAALFTVGGAQAGNAGMEVVPGSSIVIQSYNRTAGAYASLTFDSSISAFRSASQSGNLTTFRAATATTLNAATVGALFDYTTSFTNSAYDFTGISLTTAAVTAAASNTLRGIKVAPGAITNASGTSTYRGVEITMPAITQSAGSLTAVGLYIGAGTVTSGTAYALVTEASAGNVGIGTASPSHKLTIASAAATPTRSLDISGSTTGFNYASMSNTSGSLWWGVEGSSAGQIFASSLAYASLLGSSNATALQLASNGTVRMTLDASGNIGIGTNSPNANAILDVSSTTKAFMPPRMTTVQRDAIPSPTAGMVVFDTTLGKIAVYTTAWEAVTSA